MGKDHRPAVVIDTNVWISGLLFGGNPKKIIQKFISGDIIVIVSEEILSELRRIVHQKFPLFIEHLPILEALIKELSVIVRLGNDTVLISRDKDDNKIIETAVAGNAEYIISGDQDLLALQSYNGIKIVNPVGFLVDLRNLL